MVGFKSTFWLFVFHLYLLVFVSFLILFCLLLGYCFCLNALDKCRPTPANTLLSFLKVELIVSISYRNLISSSHLCSLSLILSKLTWWLWSPGDQWLLWRTRLQRDEVNLGCGGKNVVYSKTFFSALHCPPTSHMGRQYYRIISSICFMSSFSQPHTALSQNITLSFILLPHEAVVGRK